MPHKSYTVKYVACTLEVLKWNEKMEVISKTSRQFQVDRKRVCEWLQQKDSLRLNSRGKADLLKRLHPGGQFNQEHDMAVLNMLLDECCWQASDRL